MRMPSRRRQLGASASEYAILVAVIIVAIYIGVSEFLNLNGLYELVSNKVLNVIKSGP